MATILGPMLTTVAEWFRVMAVAQIAVFTAILARDHWSNPSARVTVAFLLGVVGYVSLPIALTHGAPVWAFHALFVVSATIPFSFWLLARVHFDDTHRVPATAWSIPVALVVSNYAMAYSYDSGHFHGLSPGTVTLIRFVPRALGGALVVHAAYRVVRGIGTELVTTRLWMRYLFLATSGACILAVLAGEALLMSDDAEVPAAAHFGIALTILVLASGYSFAFGSVSAGFLRPTPVERRESDPELRRRFERLMAESVYREPGLTIRKLAERIGDSETSVRARINGELGFKNFNAFLNHYRIEDAKRVLEDRDSAARTIADIAFEMGYGSLGPFNKAFRELVGKTPSAYRKQLVPTQRPG